MVDLGAWVSEGYKISHETHGEKAQESQNGPDEDDLHN